MEALVPSKVASLSVSNTDLESLRQLCKVAIIKPVTVQNRFTHDTIDRPDPTMPSNLPYPLVTFDRDVREYCQQHEIAYAPWGTLWGSLDFLDGPEQMMEKAGHELGFSKYIACYALMRSLGGCKLSILCGTTNEVRMRETLEGLANVQRYLVESEDHRKTWKFYVDYLKVIVDGEKLG